MSGEGVAALRVIGLPRPANHSLTKTIIVDFASLMLLLVMGALVWLWLHSIRILELACEVGRQACNQAEVQFWDDTVASTGLVLARDKNGRRILRRTYRFEFTETGNSRREGGGHAR